jgi:glycosyltransferase involved in cell wall biosynthesis
MLINDGANWVISREMKEIADLCGSIGVKLIAADWFRESRSQSVFYGSRWSLMPGALPKISHRLGMTWFHGKPGTGVPGFDHTYNMLRQHHERIHRIQTSHCEMFDLVLESGIDPAKVFLIPIGINLSYFSVVSPSSRREVREKYGVPQSAVVVGSFQKDGNGWDEGLEAKTIKGPDIFIKSIKMLKQRIPDIFVLLSGPARGFMKAGLKDLGVPYKHVYLESYEEVAQLYHALDVYIVSSRQEGGPKAVLESMASGIPLVTTRVGQAMDLVKHAKNAWMVDVDDADGLAYWAEYAVSHPDTTKEVLREGRITAEANSYDSQIPLWREFMRGFVNVSQ